MKGFMILVIASLIATGSCFPAEPSEPQCPKDIEVGKEIYLPNKDDCSSYWVCGKSGYPILDVCFYGTLFDEEQLTCVDYESAICGDRPRPPTRPTTTPTVPTRPTRPTTTPTVPTTTTEPTTTTTEPTTTTTEPTTTTTEPTTTTTEPTTTTTEPTTTTTEPTTTTTEPTTTTTEPTTTTTEPTTTTTEPTTTTTEPTTTTTEPTTTTTEPTTTTTKPTTTTTKPTTTTTEQTTTTTEPTTTTSSSSTTQESEEYPVYCPPQLGFEDNFFLPNPKDCHTFYHCAYGIPYLTPCPEPLLFNPELSACDWPRNVTCHVSLDEFAPKVDVVTL